MTHTHTFDEDLLCDIFEFLQGQYDTADGTEGPRPNRAMELGVQLEQMLSTHQKIDGYAVVTADGYFVGAWRDEATAKTVINRSPMSKGEEVRPFTFVCPF